MGVTQWSTVQVRNLDPVWVVRSWVVGGFCGRRQWVRRRWVLRRRWRGVVGGRAKQGGALRFGAQGGASTDTLDGQNGLTNADFNRIYQLYDQLVVLDAQGQPQLSMAKPFTADDVLFSLNRIVSMKYPGATSLGPVDLASSKVANPTTLLVGYHQPF